VLDSARQTPAAVGTLLIVGHDPAMRGLTLELAGEQLGDTGAEAVGRVRAKYPTAAIAVLYFLVIGRAEPRSGSTRTVAEPSSTCGFIGRPPPTLSCSDLT
jgi:phosphohistidine phosphatase SixA